MTPLEQAKAALLCAALEETKESWAADALSYICGEFDRTEWTPAALRDVFDRIAMEIGGNESAKLLIVYLFGFLADSGDISAAAWLPGSDAATPINLLGGLDIGGNSVTAGDLVIDLEPATC